MSCRVLIVDDEPLARSRLRRLLARHEDLEIAGECGDGESAIDALRAEDVDVLFLDVQLPGLDGFQVLASVPRERIPVVVFVTAHDRHAVRAFEVHALDYLLKPFGAARLAKAVERARAELERRGRLPAPLDPGLERLLASLRERSARPERIAVKSGGRITFLELRTIDWIEAAGKHVRLHAGARTHLLRRTMDQILRLLDPARFARVHRSAIVQLDRIVEAEPAFHGDFRLRLRDGTELTLSRTYRQRLEEALGQEL